MPLARLEALKIREKLTATCARGEDSIFLWRQAQAHLDRHDIVFQPGLNEDLAATALWGEQAVATQSEVMSGFLMSGGSDYLLRCVVRDLEHYRDLLDDLTSIPGVAHIQSSFAVKSFINRPAPMIK